MGWMVSVGREMSMVTAGVGKLGEVAVMAGAEAGREESAEGAMTKLDSYEGRGTLPNSEGPVPSISRGGAKAGSGLHWTDFTQDDVQLTRLLLLSVPVELVGLPLFSSL